MTVKNLFNFVTGFSGLNSKVQIHVHVTLLNNELTVEGLIRALVL